MIDTHSHINFEDYKENFVSFIDDLKNNEIDNVIIPGVEPSSFDEIISLCEKYDILYGAITPASSNKNDWMENPKNLTKR